MYVTCHADSGTGGQNPIITVSHPPLREQNRPFAPRHFRSAFGLGSVSTLLFLLQPRKQTEPSTVTKQFDVEHQASYYHSITLDNGSSESLSSSSPPLSLSLPDVYSSVSSGLMPILLVSVLDVEFTDMARSCPLMSSVVKVVGVGSCAMLFRNSSRGDSPRGL